MASGTRNRRFPIPKPAKILKVTGHSKNLKITARLFLLNNNYLTKKVCIDGENPIFFFE